MNHFAKVATGLALAFAAASAQAAVTVFTDDFEGYGSGDKLNWDGGGNWTVVDGTVDIVQIPNYFGILDCGGSGHCLDLDGSTNDAGVIFREFQATAGQTYTFKADISGSQRYFANPADQYRNAPNTVTYGFQTAGGTDLSVGSTGPVTLDTPFSPVIASFFAATSGTYRVFFSNAGGDSVGLLADNVSLTAVPLPAAAWLLLSGLGGVAAFARRRRVAPAAA